MQLLNQAILYDPKCIAAFQGRGDILVQLGYWGEALSEFDAAIELRPTVRSLRFKRAKVLEQLGLFTFARQELELVEELEPEEEGYFF
jgi:Flp pilus assembly protein TadD